jgi:hypothetical protein
MAEVIISSLAKKNMASRARTIMAKVIRRIFNSFMVFTIYF